MAQAQLRYPSLAEVIAIHEKVMRGLGGGDWCTVASRELRVIVLTVLDLR